MKKYFFLNRLLTILTLICIACLVSGCFTGMIIIDNIETTKAQNQYDSYEENIIPSKIKKSNIVGKLYVKKTMKDGAIVCTDTTCHYSITKPVIFFNYNIKNYYSDLRTNSKHQKTEKPLMMYLENINNIEFYDGLIIDILDSMNIVKNGTYTYIDDNGTSITIPKVKIKENYENK